MTSVELTNVVANAAPFHITIVELINPEPATSRTLSADSATTLGGVTDAMVGAGLDDEGLFEDGLLEVNVAPPPPQAAKSREYEIKIATHHLRQSIKTFTCILSKVS